MAASGVARPECRPFTDRLQPEDRDLVLTSASRISYPAGSVSFHPGDPDRADILDSGMARGFLTSSDGRQTTLRYVHPGELMGGLMVMHGELLGSVQMVVDSVVVHLDVANFRRLISSNARVAEAIAGDLSLRLEHTVRTVAIHAFGSVAQRLAFDLLERACCEQQGSGILETNASQQELADGVGSVRDVVARAMRQLRDRGLIETSRRYIRVVNARALDDFAAQVLRTN
jgi:CRP/FNR family transcriptional regulator